MPIVTPITSVEMITECEQQQKSVPPLPISINDFKLLQVLGKGCMGKVM